MKVSPKALHAIPVASQRMLVPGSAATRTKPPSASPPRPTIRDFETLDDSDLIGLLLGLAPRHPIATWIAEQGLEVLASHGVGSLAEAARLQRTRAIRLQAAVELGLRVARRLRSAPDLRVRSARDVDTWARRKIADLSHEELWVLLLDPRNRVVGERMLARGGLHGCALHVRDVLRPILREARSAFILVHNHPGGDPCPSREDVTFTHRVGAAAHMVELVLVDHVVVAREGYVSMLEAGMIDGTAS